MRANVKALEDVLNQFIGTKVESWSYTHPIMEVLLEIDSLFSLRKILNATQCGSNPWHASIVKPNPGKNSVKILLEPTFLRFAESDVKRDVDYKICMLKSELGL